MNQERDKFLTEAMGECWHEYSPRGCTDDYGCTENWKCKLCGLSIARTSFDRKFEKSWDVTYADFSTWEGFGKLWEWAYVQPWFWKGVFGRFDHQIPELYVHPDRLANMVYQYLQRKREEDE